MDSLRLDLRYAVRALLGRPGFSAIAVLTLALGIGVNTVAFSAINALLLRPFRMADADRIGWIMVPGPGNPRGYVSSSDLEALERGAQSLDGIAAEARIPVSLRTSGGAEQRWALLVSSNYLRTLRATPALGRVFAEPDVAGSELPVVVSYRFWTERLGATRALGDQTVVVNGRSFSVVGVLPDDFQGPGGLFAPDLWLPLARMEVLNLPNRLDRPWLTMFARLKPGASRAQAEAELTAVARDLSTTGGRTSARTATFYLMEDGHPDLREISATAWIALALVGIVLLIACFNVASLVLAQANERRQEFSIRSAVGASRARILRQLVTEGLLLALVSGAASLVVAAWSGDLLATFSLPAPIPQRIHLGVDRMLVGFTAVLVLVAGVVPALFPAFHATRANLLRSMRMESVTGGRPSGVRNAFVVAQIAGSTFFMVIALLFVRSFVNSAAVDPGFDTARTVVLQLSPAAYGYDDIRSRLLFHDLQQKLSAIPGVRQVAMADRVPFYVGSPQTMEYSIDAADCATTDCPLATIYGVGPAHFSALGIPLEAGRDFSAQDMHSGAGVVISRHMASELWPGESAIGRTVRIGESGRSTEIIGVAADIKHRNMAERPGAYLYRPLRAAEYANGLSMIVRVQHDPRQMLNTIREQVRAVDPNLPADSLATMSERMTMPLWPARTAAGFFTICATLAISLASIGLFGVMYFTVSQRTREFSIRAALGATRRRVIALVLRQGLRLAVPGIVLGGIAGYIAGRLLARALFGVSPADPLTYAVTAATEIGITLLACALPAHLATRAQRLHGLHG
jgi:predicted permease